MTSLQLVFEINKYSPSIMPVQVKKCQRNLTGPAVKELWDVVITPRCYNNNTYTFNQKLVAKISFNWEKKPFTHLLQKGYLLPSQTSGSQIMKCRWPLLPYYLHRTHAHVCTAIRVTSVVNIASHRAVYIVSLPDPRFSTYLAINIHHLVSSAIQFPAENAFLNQLLRMQGTLYLSFSWWF